MTSDELAARLIALRDHLDSFDQLLGRVSMYGSADAVRDRWRWLKLDIEGLITALRQDPRSAHETEDDQSRGDDHGHVRKPGTKGSTTEGTTSK